MDPIRLPSFWEVGLRLSRKDFIVSSAQISEFRFLYFYVPDTGLFIVSAKPFDDSTQAGSFDGKDLTAEIAGISLRLHSRTAMLGSRAIPAWIRFDSEFNLDVKRIVFGYGDNDRVPYVWPSRT